MSPHILQSWKEIARYCQRGVRTVQRWEKEQGLPVSRPEGKESVYADAEAIDRWQRARLKLSDEHQNALATSLLHDLVEEHRKQIAQIDTTKQHIDVAGMRRTLTRTRRTFARTP